jgi:peptide/nickel transport system permease protein
MRNIGGVFALGYIGLCFFVALFAYMLASDGSKNANQMHLSLHSQSPGFQVQMLHIPSDLPSVSLFEKLFFGDPNLGTYYPISNYRLAAEGIYIEHFNFDAPGKNELIPFERFNEVTSPETIEATYLTTKKFLLGTDLFGRDILSRLLVHVFHCQLASLQFLFRCWWGFFWAAWVVTLEVR